MLEVGGWLIPVNGVYNQLMSKVELVGILNLTPDSFSGDGLTDYQRSIDQAEQMFKSGASSVDVGAESTRPGATPISAKEEWKRLSPVITNLAASHPAKFSVDTHHPQTILKLHKEIGKFRLNDVTGLNSPEVLGLVIKLMLPVIISHFPSSLGQDIQAGHQQENKINSLSQVKNELLAKRRQLIDSGIDPSSIILDPGIGFGKTIDLNWRLLRFAEETPGIDVMIGYSKKSFMAERSKLVEQNLEAGRIAIAAGAKYLRLHADLLKSHAQLLN